MKEGFLKKIPQLWGALILNRKDELFLKAGFSGVKILVLKPFQKVLKYGGFLLKLLKHFERF